MLSKPAQNNLPQKELKHIKQLESFTSNLQKGDLYLNKLIAKAFVLYGQTKTGKTATSHILTGCPLQGKYRDGTNIVQPTTSRYKTAIIGNRGNSQTQIPNLFECKLRNETVYVIDTPGYGDSYGVLKILSNGYYHYRVYSKVEKMKFIICFENNHLQNTAEKFIDTIKQFTSSFKDYLTNEKVRAQIWESSVFLITKVPTKDENQAINNIKSKLKSLVETLKTQLFQQQEKIIKDFIQYIMNNDKIFVVPQIAKGQTPQFKGLLNKIDQKISKWWCRQLHPTKPDFVDMSRVSFAIGKQICIAITTQDKSKQQFKQLIIYYNNRNKEICEQFLSANDHKKYSLDYVLQELVLDAMGSPDSHRFLEALNLYKAKYYFQLDQNYKQVRQKRQKELFQTEKINNGSNSLTKVNKQNKNYMVQKFKVLQQIQNEKKKSNDRQFQDRNIVWLQRCEESMYNIIKEFNKISYKKLFLTDTIYKYGYLIHRIIEEAKLFCLLIEIQTDADTVKRIQGMIEQPTFEIFRIFKDFMGMGFCFENALDIDSKTLHKKYIQRFKYEQQFFKKITVNEVLVDFFTKINISQNQIVKSINKLVLRYADQIIQKSQNQEDLELLLNEKNRLIKRLTLARINSENLINLAQNNKQKSQNLILLRMITKDLGKVLQIVNKYQLARQVYETIRYVSSVCKIFDKQMAQDFKNIFLRIKYSKYLSEHFREQQAIELLQQTYEIVETKQHLDLIKQQLTDLRLKVSSNNKTSCTYEEQMFNNQDFDFFDQDIQNRLMKIGAGISTITSITNTNKPNSTITPKSN